LAASTLDYFPIFLKLDDSPCLVVGGGEIARRKIKLLLRAHAQVSVVATNLGPGVKALADKNQIQYADTRFSEEQLDSVKLVIAATDDSELNRQVAEAARARNLPVNVVDQPELCSFILPSIVDRSPVVIAVGTGGASPVLARMLRSRLETLIPTGYGRLAKLAREFRNQVQSVFETTRQRRAFWEEIFQGPIAEMVFSGKEGQARKKLNHLIASADPRDYSRGEVYLVGAGPGDPDLLTFRALRLMQQADVVLYDRLVADEILDLVRREADRIYVGKKKSDHAASQKEINQLLVDLATAGKRVLRLKGGDPFIFGRGSEEIEDLVKTGIPFQVIPGITAASGCASYAGIPLTHRDFAKSCVFVTGHLKEKGLDLNWDQLCQPDQTVVVYMSLTGLEVICREMITHGSPAYLPAALIQQGTTSEQKVIIGTLKTLPGKVANGNVKAPTLLIIGNVVKLHSTLGWFEPNDIRSTQTVFEKLHYINPKES
jgi:uroporphyrin-III C-methyltransferase/precorrin-2 dehydrogenase/sirohydrochlorin ferrochelatase